MALAQPTGLNVQNLTPIIQMDQDVERHNETDVLLAEAGDVLATEDSRDIASERLTFVQFMQLVDDSARFNEGGTLITLDQSVIFVRDNPSATLITLSQDVERHNSSVTLLTFRQVVLSPVEAAKNLTFVYLDGAEVTSQCSPGIRVTASENDNRTAQVTLVKLPAGSLSATSYQGRSVNIVRKIGTSLVTIFKGTVERPVYDVYSSSLLLECSDLRNERIGREDHSRLLSLTGGIYSPITQREEASGAQWVRELMKTVQGSLDYTGAGALRYSPWATGTPDYNLTGSDVYHRDIKLEFATRSSIVNRIQATLEYRYYQRNTITHNVQTSMRRDSGTSLPRPGDTIPTKSAMLAAIQGVSGWHVVDLSVGGLPDDGWYLDTSTAFIRRVGFSANVVARETRGMGLSATFERYISQPRRETYDIRIEAPESIDQFGVVDGGEMRFAVESNIDPSVFEERGCFIIANPDDRRADVNTAIQAVQLMSEKQILAGHRANYAEFDYRGEILPVEIGDTVSVSSSPFDVTGNVTEISHIQTVPGDVITSVKLAVSRVDSDVIVTEDWGLPAQPAKFSLAPAGGDLLETPDCPAPTGEVAPGETSNIEPDGTVIVVAPSVGRAHVDEIRGTREHTYSVEIPVDQMQIEVAL